MYLYVYGIESVPLNSITQGWISLDQFFRHFRLPFRDCFGYQFLDMSKPCNTRGGNLWWDFSNVFIHVDLLIESDLNKFPAGTE